MQGKRREKVDLLIVPHPFTSLLRIPSDKNVLLCPLPDASRKGHRAKEKWSDIHTKKKIPTEAWLTPRFRKCRRCCKAFVVYSIIFFAVQWKQFPFDNVLLTGGKFRFKCVLKDV